jgi:hypothetical protein
VSAKATQSNVNRGGDAAEVQHLFIIERESVQFPSGNEPRVVIFAFEQNRQAIRMPYFYFDIVIDEEFKSQGGMILEDTQIAIE